jgi:putative transposase
VIHDMTVSSQVVQRSNRFELRLRPEEAKRLARIAGSCRWVSNRALHEQRARHARGDHCASYEEMARWLTTWRNAHDTSWLAEAPVHTQQQSLMRLASAYERFFRARQSQCRVGPPRFKRRGEMPGLRFPDAKQVCLDIVNGRIKLPKLGWLRLRLSRPVEGPLRNVSITCEGARWFASLQVEQRVTALALDVAPTLGIDLGLTKFAALSDGALVEPLKAMAKQQRRLRYAQRAVTRKQKGSANRCKAVDRLGRLHRRISRQRSDWLHKLTADLAGRHSVIALEDLRITNMSASARGSVGAPGRSVRAKAGLNRAIHDAGWGEFARQLSYKLQWRGGRVILVNPAYSSRTCRVCGHESADNRKTQALFRCVACGHAENADVHAAKNILTAGHAVWLGDRSAAACGGNVSRSQPRRLGAVCAVPTKQEPLVPRALA